MNTIVEAVNAGGRAFVDFSVPMFIQSGVLILILLVLDVALRRKVRAVFRYWIWTLVLVKLVLPPSLGSPVSLGKWFGDRLEVPASSLLHPESRGTVSSPTVDGIFAPPDPVIARPLVPPPAAPAAGYPKAMSTPASVAEASTVLYRPAASLSWQGLVLLVWAVVVSALTLLLIQRAFFVRGLVGQADRVNPAMSDELENCRRRLGLRMNVGVRLSPNATSPAVCGLLRPVILVPQTLAPRLQTHDLQAVLLHELAHVKRGDLWINLLQTLLQIAYFYNPLLWLANAMIRRTREQAVDETVLVAMGETARQYPETLVNIAKLAFTRRPALSLRLIGVVESKSALTARIKHILGRPLPKSARLGFFGLLLVLIIAAVLLPMAKAKPVADRGQEAIISSTGEQQKAGGRNSTSRDFTAILPSGVTVELLGISEHPSAGKSWWRPDGSPLREVPYDGISQFVGTSDEDKAPFDVAFRVRDLPENYEASADSPGTNFMTADNLPYKAGKLQKDLRWLIVEAEPNQTTCAVRCDVVGPWQVVARSSPETDPSPQAAENSVAFSDIREDSGHVVRVTVTGHVAGLGYDSSPSRRELRRVVAVKKDGQVEESLFGGLRSAESPDKATVYFLRLSLNEIKEFQFQVRAATYVEFKNVSLRPGQRTDVRIDVGFSDAAMAVPEGMVGTWRYENPIGDDEQMAIFPDGRVVVVYSNGHKDETRYDHGFITLHEYNDIRVKLVLDDNGTILEYAGGPDTDIYGKRWKRIDPEPKTELLAPLTEAAPRRADATARLKADLSARSIVLPDVDSESVMLDLATGRLIPIPQVEPADRLLEAIKEFTKGDLVLDQRSLILLRGATSPQATEGPANLTKVIRIGSDLPRTITVTTAEGRQYKIEVLSIDDSACTLKDSPIGADRGVGGGAPAEPGEVRGSLEFRIAPNVDDLEAGAVEEYRKALTEGRTSTDGRYIWAPVRPETNLPPLVVDERHEGRLWLLLWNEPSHAMLAGQGWGLKSVYPTTDAMGRPSVGLTFDEKGTQLLRELTQANVKKSLAIVLDGEVRSASTIVAPVTGGQCSIVGNFTQKETGDIIAALRKDADAQPAESGAPGSGQGEDRLKQLLADARPGSVVVVPAGRYRTPLEITKPLTLRGEAPGGCVIEVTADRSAILIDTRGQGQATLENLTIRWQLATNRKVELPSALLVKDTNAVIRNCAFAPLGDYQRSPMAVYIDGRSKSLVDNCQFRGFEYTICYGRGTEGVVQDCIIADCGHQGVINYDGATLTVQRNLITGSRFHAVRCTGGTLHVKDNLLIANANRGIYLGNKTGRGTITNNLIVGNGTGISAFGRADYAVANNVLLDNEYAGLDMRDSCRLSIRDNVLVRNQRGIALHKEGAENFNVVTDNAFWSNTTDVENLEKPADSLTADPQFADPNHGDFSVRGPVQKAGPGLTDPQIIKELWKRYEQLQNERSAQTEAISPSPPPQTPTVSAGVLAWQRTDRYVPPDPNGFFPDDPEGGKKLDVLFQAGDRDGRPDEEILSTARRGLRRTVNSHNSILQWIGGRFIGGKQAQNPEAIELMYHAVPLEQHYAVYSGLSLVKDKSPNILRTLADICMQGEEVGRITWGVGAQREQLVSCIAPHLQDEDPAGQEMAAALLKHFEGELDFESWLPGYRVRQGQIQFGPQLAQFKETLLTGDSEARYQTLTTIVHNQKWIEILDDSFLPVLQTVSADPNPRVRKLVANAAGYRWLWLTAALPQDPNVIELMLKLSTDDDREVRYDAVYYGLSGVRDKSETVVRRLVEMALADQENDLHNRIVWGLKQTAVTNRPLVERILTAERDDANTEVRRSAVRRLWQDVLGTEPLPVRETSR